MAEIERKWLVDDPPHDLAEHPSQQIDQGYLAIDPDGTEVRVRRSDNVTVMTIKQGGGRTRAEEEFAIPAARFERLWPLTANRRVQKRRYRIPGPDGLTFELDDYGGDHQGLVVVETEFPDERSAESFTPPAWFGREVTDDPRYKNQNLAQSHGSTFELEPGEPAAEGVRRIARGQLDDVAEHLDVNNEKSVHEARKSFKRLRALVRLSRDELGDEVRRRENAAFRDAGRALSGARDAAVLVKTLDGLDPKAFGGLRTALAEDSGGQPDEAAVKQAVDDARGRVATWPLDGDATAALASGFKRIRKRGRGAYKAAERDPSTEHLHELRKRTKDLWHAAQILTPEKPERMRKLAGDAHELADLLGDDHDLATLQAVAGQHRATLTDDEHARLTKLIERRRKQLQREALGRAKALY